MPADKPDLNLWKNTVLLHNGAAHNLSQVLQLALADSAPTVTVDLDQIGPLPSDVPTNLFLVQPKNAEINQLPLVLYKHSGRFFALAGEAHVTRAKTNQQTQISGKLLSTPALKKARIVKAENVLPPVPAQPQHRSEFRRNETRRY